MSYFDDLEDLYDNIEARISDSVSSDAPPPPTREVVDAHNRAVAAAGTGGPILTFDPEVAAQAEADFRNGTGSLADRISSPFSSITSAFEGIGEMSSAVKWIAIAGIVALAFIAILIIFGSAFFVFQGTFAASKAFFASGGLDLLNPIPAAA